MLFLSIASSILGILILLATNYKVIRIYFAAVWVLTLTLAALHGLILLPSLLALMTCYADEKSRLIIGNKGSPPDSPAQPTTAKDGGGSISSSSSEGVVDDEGLDLIPKSTS